MTITDQLTAQVAGRCSQLVEEGYDFPPRSLHHERPRNLYEHLDAVVAEAKARGRMPALPVGI